MKIDLRDGVILFEDGTIVEYTSFFPEIRGTRNLAEICSTSNIRDLAFFRLSLVYRNYSGDRVDLAPDRSEYSIGVIADSQAFKLDTDYNIVTVFGMSDMPERKLLNCLSLDLDIQGNYYIIDGGDSTVKVFDKNGEFLNRWANIGNPSYIKIYDDIVYVLDKSSNSIKKYDYEGNLIDTAISGNLLDDIVTFAFEGAGLLWIADMNGTRLVQIQIPADILEIKNDYCFEKQTYLFNDVSSIDPFPGAFNLVDYGNNLALYFSSFNLSRH